MIELNFTLEDTKMLSKVSITKPNKIDEELTLIIDCGCSMTTMTPQLFQRLGFPKKDESPITIYGINSEEKGFSTLIPSFKLGAVELGEIRVAVANMRPEYQNSILLGMNILGWFDFGWQMRTKRIYMYPRNFADANYIQEGFRLKNPKTKLLAAEVDDV